MKEKGQKIISRTNTFWIPAHERIKFYLNDQESFRISVSEFERVKDSNYWNGLEMKMISYQDYQNTFTHWYCQHMVHLPVIKNFRVLPYYKSYKNLHSLLNFFKPIDELGMDFKDTVFPMYFGEAGFTDGIPCIRKSRRSDDSHSVLYNFRTLRLNEPCQVVEKYDIDWQDKKNNVIWRGATTGQQQRVDFVKKYIDKYEVAFATIKQKPELGQLKRNKVSIEDQLQYKFIVSLEGNDLASNLRWILSSNSVPIMTKPYWQSWIMEERLVPNVHYLELNEDLSNLEELLEWAAAHDEECHQIAQNGKQYMAQFLDLSHDLPIQKMLLEEYAKRVTYIK